MRLAPLEHGFVCGLAHVGLGPRQCAATPILPYVASVGVEMVSGTAGARVFACVVAAVAEVSISGILMVFEWGAAMVIVSVGHMLMSSGDVFEVPYPCLCCDDAENMRGSFVCGFLHGEDGSSQDRSIAALSWLVVVACVYRFQPFVCVFSPSCCLSCALPVSFRDAKEHASKVWGKTAKVKRNPFVSRLERLKPRLRL